MGTFLGEASNNPKCHSRNEAATNPFQFTPSDASFSEIDELSSAPDRHFASEAVLNLEGFERFVFIMSILEHYSDHDCALLLGCSPRDILEARARALRKLMESSRRIY